MLNDTTKRKINSLRDILVGKVPDPKSQVEQITNALIYKYMDDMDQQAIVYGGKASFFTGEYQKYSWKNLMDPKLGGQDRMNLYTESLEKMSRNKNLSPIFRDILKGAFLPYRSPETLNMFLHEIDGFSYDHSEDLGDAFEYLLAIMGSQGDAGQFRTPRHIIDFIVDVIDPQKDETILDPACGTAGFLISAYKHILENRQDKSGASIIHDEMRTLHKNFTGYDISPEMVKLSRVNMFLHNFPEPKIFEYDTLSSDERWDDNFDVILANPPFMTPKGGIIPHKRFSVPANRAEVLFVDYIMNHLRSKGRAGIIVPEGIIFQSGNVYKQLRKNLVEDGLYAVVSLPSGVFAPYSGVKTSILLFNNELAKQSKEILFVKVENDGYDLGAQRREIQKNDLPKALEILNKWKTTSVIPTGAGIRCIAVEKSKIAESGDYNLSGDRYRVTTDYSNAKWPIVELGKICEIIAGQSPEGKFYNENGEGMPFYQGKTEFTDQYISDPKKWTTQLTKIAEKNDILMSMRAPVGPVNIATQKICIGRGLASIRPIKANSAYVFALLKLMQDSIVGNGGAVFDSISKNQIEKIKIPLPPLEIQEQIVAELDGYQKIITGAKQIVENWKPRIEIDAAWKMAKLSEVCKTTSGGTPLKSVAEYYKNGDIPWLRSGEVAQGFVTKSELFITKEGLKKSSAKLFPINTVLVAMYGATAGQVGILKFESATNQAVCGVLPNKKFVPEFLFQILKDQKDRMISLAGGGAQPNISQGIIGGLEIPLVSLKIQKQIVEKIEAERALVESAKKLIGIYEEKTKEVIGKLWKE